MAKEIVPIITKSISYMTLRQRIHLAVNKDDVFFSFPYQVGIILDDDYKTTKRSTVEIMMVFHVLKGLAEMNERGERVNIGRGMPQKHKEMITVCNYRFVREFTHGVKPDWTINMINHFKPQDYFI